MASQTVAASAANLTAGRFFASTLPGDALSHAYEAQAVIGAAAEKHCSAAVSGVDDLVGLAVDALVEAAGWNDSPQLEEHASAQLEQAIAVLNLLNEGGLNDMLLYAGGSLLSLSKRILDAHIEACASRSEIAETEVNHA